MKRVTWDRVYRFEYVEGHTYWGSSTNPTAEFWFKPQPNVRVVDTCGECGDKMTFWRLVPALYWNKKHKCCEKKREILIDIGWKPGEVPCYQYCCEKGGLCPSCVTYFKNN